jgi:DNA-binding NarL/FixJ family response regulator
MRIAPPVLIDSSRRETLRQWARSRSLPVRQIERARIVLFAAEGKTDLEIAASLNISNQSLKLKFQRQAAKLRTSAPLLSK